MSGSSNRNLRSGEATRWSHTGALVGALLGLACLVLLGANGSAAQIIEETKLLASDGAPGYTFGGSISVSGGVAVVGAPAGPQSYYDPRYGPAGRAYVTRFDGSSWVEEAKLQASDAAGNDHFGNSVSVVGDVAVVGASGYGRPPSYRSGSAYVFRFDGANWVQENKLLPLDGAARDEFGNSVSVSGDFAVVGSPCDDDNGNCSGSVYVYRFNGSSWIQRAKLLPSDGAADDFFGASVSLSGDFAMVGAFGDDDNGDKTGSVYVYRFDGSNWVEEAKILASDVEAGDYFGTSVSVLGDVAVVGADGSAYVYRFDGTNWVEEAKLLASDGAPGDDFGRSVSVSGDVAVIGASRDDDNGEWSGSAYLYRFDGSNWVEEAKLLASDGTSEEEFGDSVSVSGDFALVGAHHDDDDGDESGSVYVFSELGSAPACSDGIDNDGDGLADLADPGCAVALDTSEHSGKFECDDGVDNDWDGKIDYPNDPACSSVTGDLEGPQCDDGIDNDWDGKIDYPNDPACSSVTGDLEGPQCDDGLDNDDDGLVDHPEDPDCVVPTDNSEYPSGPVDDGDLLVVTDAGLLWFDPATHDQGVVLDGRFIGDVVTSASGEIFVSDLDVGQIVSIDAATGEETLVADVSLIGIPFIRSGMAMASDGSLWVANFFELLRVEPATGNVTGISLPPEIGFFFDVAETAGAVYVISETGVGPVDVFRVDPDTGETELFAAGVGPPDSIHVYGEGIALAAHGSDLLVAVGSEVYRLTPPDPTPVSVATSSSGVFLDIAMADDGTLHFIEGNCGCAYQCSCSGSDAFGSAAAWRVEVFEPAACSDRIDNDGDGLIDYPDDPACFDPLAAIENPQCQDGINNDSGQDGLIDYDGGQSIWGECTGAPGGCPPEVSDPDGDGVANPDPQCVGTPWKNREARPSSCGVGAELALLLPALIWLRRSRGSKSATASP